jgi:hypothetical protein
MCTICYVQTLCIGSTTLRTNLPILIVIFSQVSVAGLCCLVIFINSWAIAKSDWTSCFSLFFSKATSTWSGRHKFSRLYLLNAGFAYLLIEERYLIIDVRSLQFGIDEVISLKNFRVATSTSICKFSKSVNMIIHFSHSFLSLLYNLLRSFFYFIYLMFTYRRSCKIPISLLKLTM